MGNTAPKPFVFVLMPFDKAFSDIYELGIKAACDDAGAYCERVDEQIFTESILDRIYNQISKADIIVSDMTGRNPNVFYETGFAHALNRQVILLTKTAEDIPFDLKHYPHIVYEGKIAELKTKLRERISWCIHNPRTRLADVDLNLRFFLNKVELINTPDIVHQSNPYVLTINNPTSKLLRSTSFSLALVVPDPVVVSIHPSSGFPVRLPDGRIMYNVTNQKNLFPEAWESIGLTIFVEGMGANLPTPFEAELRMFTEIEPKIYPFRIV